MVGIAPSHSGRSARFLQSPLVAHALQFDTAGRSRPHPCPPFTLEINTMSNAQMYVDILSLPGFLQAVGRHRKKVILTFLIMVSLTVLFVVSRQREYASSAQLFVRIGRETVSVDPTAEAAGQLISMTDTQEREIRSIVSVLGNRDLLEKVVDDLGPQAILEPASEPGPLSKIIKPIRDSIKSTLETSGILERVSDREKAIKTVKDSLEVEAGEVSSVISVSVRAETPDLAQRIVASLVDHHLNEHLEANSSRGTLPFFTAQTERLLEDLDAASSELTELKTQNSVASLEAKKESLETQMLSLNEKLSLATTGLASTSSNVAALREQLSDESELIPSEETSGMAGTAKAAMREELYRLQILESELLAKYTTNHPQVTRIREQIAQARQVFESEEEQVQMTTGKNEVYQQLRINYLVALGNQAALEAEIDALENERKKLETEIARVNQGEQQLVSLQRKVDLLDANYRRYVDNLEQVRIHQELENNQISNVNIVQQPSFVDYPVGPSNLLVLALGMIVSLACACGLALVCESMHPQEVVQRRPAKRRYRKMELAESEAEAEAKAEAEADAEHDLESVEA